MGSAKIKADCPKTGIDGLLKALGRFDDVTNTVFLRQKVNLYPLYETPFYLVLITVVMVDLWDKSWISTGFKVLDRFCNYVFQWRHLRQPQKLFGFRRSVGP